MRTNTGRFKNLINGRSPDLSNFQPFGANPRHEPQIDPTGLEAEDRYLYHEQK
jgi:hypothetical protein